MEKRQWHLLKNSQSLRNGIKIIFQVCGLITFLKWICVLTTKDDKFYKLVLNSSMGGFLTAFTPPH